MRVTPEQVEFFSDASDEMRNFRMWMHTEVIRDNGEWNWNRWYSEWQKYSPDTKLEMRVRYEIEIDGRWYI